MYDFILKIRKIILDIKHKHWKDKALSDAIKYNYDIETYNGVMSSMIETYHKELNKIEKGQEEYE